MKSSARIVSMILNFAVIGLSGVANAKPVVYKLSVTNGSQMPISPSVIYSKEGQAPAAEVSSEATAAFVKLCQSGDAASRETEIKMGATTHFTTSTTAMLFPGETKEIEVEVNDPKVESIHFETMYGKTKDACGVASFNSHALVALQQHVTTSVRAKDDVLLTGAFLDPALPAGMTYPDPTVCASAMDAISCLRELSLPNPGRHTVRFFSGYLPSLVTALELKYGAKETQALVVPTSGALQFSLKLKH